MIGKIDATGSPLLRDIPAQYVTGRDITRESGKLIRLATERFSEFLLCPATVAHLRHEVVNAWLAERIRQVGRRTARNNRASIITLWRWCYNEESLTEVPPLRVRLIKAPLPPVAAYTRAEVERLLAACETLHDAFYIVPMRRCDLYRALIMVAWHTAFRSIDLVLLRWQDISSEGCVRIVQSKTGTPQTRWLDKETMAALDVVRVPGVDLVFGKYLSRETWRGVFRQLRTAAGIARGTPKWIRRAAGTQIAILYGEEAASRVLGHKTLDMARKHYIDSSQLLIGQLKMPRLRRFRFKPK